jgi:hypothetical protein
LLHDWNSTGTKVRRERYHARWTHALARRSRLQPDLRLEHDLADGVADEPGDAAPRAAALRNPSSFSLQTSVFSIRNMRQPKLWKLLRNLIKCDPKPMPIIWNKRV